MCISVRHLKTLIFQICEAACSLKQQKRILSAFLFQYSHFLFNSVILLFHGHVNVLLYVCHFFNLLFLKMESRVRLPAFFVSIFHPYQQMKSRSRISQQERLSPCLGMAIQMYEYDTSSMVFVHQNDKSRADPNTTFARKI